MKTEREGFHWKDHALCKGLDTETFYDDYESDDIAAEQADAICIVCPVQRQCFQAGRENNETGCWGGVYLDKGKVSDKNNAHKSAQDWKRIEDRLQIKVRR